MNVIRKRKLYSYRCEKFVVHRETKVAHFRYRHHSTLGNLRVFQAYHRHLVVVGQITHSQRSTIVACERHDVYVREKDRCLMSESEAVIYGNRSNRRVWPKDREELFRENLEERRSRTSRIKQIRVVSKSPVGTNNREGKRIDELHVIGEFKSEG